MQRAAQYRVLDRPVRLKTQGSGSLEELDNGGYGV
ncbi:hypothetical protein OCAE111667_23625 [Occultella aeris]|uniref:Uncharacterized protein n=1 Tax=Occultella aeris TaxID=2761496 RepID=A0A7M4DHJ4_9MICO|nr:hypothetical protein HALOF300_01592 [Occultella aeris]